MLENLVLLLRWLFARIRRRALPGAGRMTSITVGNPIFVDELDSPTFSLSEHDRTGTVINRLLATDGSDPNYSIRTDSPLAQLNNDLLVYGERDSTNTGRCIFKIARDGTKSDFILNAALATVETAIGGRAQTVCVDSTGRIYVIYVKTDQSTGTIMRFNSDGTHDTDFTIGRIILGGIYGSEALEHHLLGGGWTISPDGRYVYGFQFSIEAFAHYNVDHHTLYKWDTTASMAATLVYDYVENTFTTLIGGVPFATGEFIEDQPYRALGYNPFTDELFVSVDNNHHIPTPLSNTHTYRIDRFDLAGTLIQSYPVDTAIAGWDHTPVGTVRTGAFGLNFGFDKVGNGHAWVFVENTASSGDTTWGMSLDLGTGAIAVMANYIPTFAQSDQFLLLYVASGFPGLALYPAAGGSAIFGPAFTL